MKKSVVFAVMVAGEIFAAVFVPWMIGAMRGLADYPFACWVEGGVIIVMASIGLLIFVILIEGTWHFAGRLTRRER